jgi:hypothetical protein
VCKRVQRVPRLHARPRRDATLASLKQELTSHFDHVLELPVMATMEPAAKGRLAPLFEHMAAGLRDAEGFKADKALPNSWEARMRELLLQPDAVQALTALQLPLEGVRRRLAELLGAVVAGGPKEERKEDATASRRYRWELRRRPGLGCCCSCAAWLGAGALARVLVPRGRAGQSVWRWRWKPACLAACLPASSSVRACSQPLRPCPTTRRYFSISSKSWLQPVMKAVRPLLPPELQPQLKADDLHVTLWHKDDPELGPDEAMRDALAAVEGQVVRLRLAALYHSPEVSCAEVELLDAPDAAGCKDFYHITLRTAPGVAAKSSNQLPVRQAAGEEGVWRMELQPLVLEGAIAAR